MNQLVEQRISNYPRAAQLMFVRLRGLILDVAATTEGVGCLEETLKWGEPAYLTTQTGSGTTIRIDWKPKNPDYLAMYFNCRTSLIHTIRSLFPESFHFEGNRALFFKLSEELPEEEIRYCISLALRYHLEKAK